MSTSNFNLVEFFGFMLKIQCEKLFSRKHLRAENNPQNIHLLEAKNHQFYPTKAFNLNVMWKTWMCNTEKKVFSLTTKFLCFKPAGDQLIRPKIFLEFNWHSRASFACESRLLCRISSYLPIHVSHFLTLRRHI